MLLFLWVHALRDVVTPTAWALSGGAPAWLKSAAWPALEPSPGRQPAAPPHCGSIHPQSPLAGLLAPARREATADVVNAALLRARAPPGAPEPQAALEACLRQLVAVQVCACLCVCGARRREGRSWGRACLRQLLAVQARARRPQKGVPSHPLCVPPSFERPSPLLFSPHC